MHIYIENVMLKAFKRQLQSILKKTECMRHLLSDGETNLLHILQAAVIKVTTKIYLLFFSKLNAIS